MASITERLKARTWSQDWPSEVAADFSAPSQLHDSSPGVFSDLYQQARAEVEALSGGAPQPLPRVVRLLDRLDTWNQEHASYLTWPPTQDAWSRAVRESANRDRQEFIVLAAVYPNAVREALRDWPGLSRCVVAGWYAAAYDAARLQQASETTQQPPEKTRAPRVVDGDAKPAARQEPPSPPDWILELVSMTSQAATSSRRGSDIEKIDGFLKRHIQDSKGTSDEAAGYWFEDELLPALARLSPEQISDVLSGWPPGLKFPLNNPARTLGHGRFWAALKSGGDPSRQSMLTDALPALVDTSTWRTKDRYQVLVPMFELARSEQEFRLRLGLWLAWGGDLDAQMPDPDTDVSESKDTAFQVQQAPMVSARSWLASRGNARWNLVLDELPPRRATRAPSP